MSKRFYHGGSAGLTRGDYLQPAEALGLPPLLKTPSQPNYSPHFVYITTNRKQAQIFAFGKQGAVYEVEPLGSYGPDPDAPQAYKCRRARVVRVLQEAPVPAPPEVAEFLAANPDFERQVFIASLAQDISKAPAAQGRKREQ